MTNAEVIKKYCEKYLVGKSNFKQYIKAKPNFIFTLLDTTAMPANEYVEDIQHIRHSLIIQTVLHKRIYNELISFQNMPTDYVGMKGIFLEKAYYPEGHIRFYGDIDILVKSRNGYAAYRFLRKNGYVLNNKKDFFDNKDYSISTMRSLYFKLSQHVGMHKKEKNNPIPVEMELHGNINKCHSCDVSFDINRMVNDSIEKKVDDKLIYRVFGPEDNIAYLMFHAIRHLSYTSFVTVQDIMLNLQSFFDVAQIITIENVNWDLFVSRVNEARVAPFVSFYMKMFVDIFKDMVPDTVIEKIDELAKNQDFAWKPIYSLVMKMKPCDLIIGDFSDEPLIEECFLKAQTAEKPGDVWRNFCS